MENNQKYQNQNNETPELNRQVENQESARVELKRTVGENNRINEKNLLEQIKKLRQEQEKN